MDPVSIVSLVDGSIGLALKCAGAVQTINDLAGKYKYAKLTILSITQNLDTMQIAWDRIGAWSQAYIPYENADEDDFVSKLARFLETGSMVMAALEEELLPFSENNSSFAQRSKFVWNETTLQCHQSRIRDQAASMSLLLQAIQLPTPQDRTRLVQNSQKQFQKSDESAYSIVPSWMSISTRETDGQESIRSEEDMVYRSLSFENDLFSARVYKRNYRNPMLLQLLKGRTRKGASNPSISMPCGTTPNPRKRPFQATKRNSAASESQEFLPIATVPRTPSPTSRFAQHSYTASTENSPLREEAFDAMRNSRESLSYSPIRAETNLEGADEDETIHPHSTDISTHPTIPTSAVERLSQRPKDNGLSIRTNSILIGRLGQHKAQEVITRLEGYRTEDKDIGSAATESILPGTPVELSQHLSPASISWHEEAHGTISEAPLKQDPSKLFIDACEQGDSNVVERFLRRGQDVHTQHAYPGLHLLKGIHVAVMYGHIDVITKLLCYGASIEDETTSLGLRPLHLVAQSADVPMITYLLQRGAQVSAANKLDEQPIHLASESGSVEVLHILIEGGATVNCTDQGGRQPLHRATESSEQPDTIRFLSSMGADINARVTNLLCEQPLNIACRRDFPENVRALLALGAKSDGDDLYEFVLGTAIDHGSLSALKALLEHGVTPNQRDSHGRSALHLLVSVFYLYYPKHHEHKQLIVEKMMQLLLVHHADIHAEDYNGDTALHYLASGRSSANLEGKLAQILSDNNADPNAINKDGRTPLCLAVESQCELSVLLISLGARLLIKVDEVFVRLYVEKPADSDTPQYELHLTGSACGPEKKQAHLQGLRHLHTCFSKLGIACVMRDFGHGLTASTEVFPFECVLSTRAPLREMESNWSSR